MALAATMQLFGADHAALAALELDRPLFLSSATPQPVQLLIDRLQKTFTFHGKQTDGPWVRYSSGKVDKLGTGHTPPRVNVQQVVARRPHIIAKAACYELFELFKSIGLEYGPVFAGIEQLWIGDREALAHITVAEAMSGKVGDFVVFPGVLDAAFQSLLGAMASARPRLYLPARIGTIHVHRRLDQADGSTRSFWSHARMVAQNNGTARRRSFAPNELRVWYRLPPLRFVKSAQDPSEQAGVLFDAGRVHTSSIAQNILYGKCYFAASPKLKQHDESHDRRPRGRLRQPLRPKDCRDLGP
jgi:acyl transferase domain-containing protein